MLQFVLDTDHLTLLGYSHPRVLHHVASKPPGTVGLPIVAVEEQLRGRLTAAAKAKTGTARILQYSLLTQSIALIQALPLAPFDQPAEDQFQRLLTMRLRFGTRDQKIAAIALAANLILVTRNKRDFGQIPGLVIEDWSV